MGAAAESVSVEKEAPSRGPEAAGTQGAAVSPGFAFDPFVERLFGGTPADPPDSAAGSLAIQRLKAPVLQRAQRLYGNRASQRLIQRAGVIQRQCACGGTCPKCQEEEQQRPLQRSSSAAAPADFDGLPSSQGAPLEASARQPLETHFNADLSDVRVHTGTDDAASANQLQALAYTSGRDIYFAAGMYAPSSSSGRHLLAHEVAHVVQQSSGKQPSIATKSAHGAKIGAPDDSLEEEAERKAEEFMSGSQPGELSDEEQRRRRDHGVVQRFIQRQPAPDPPAPAVSSAPPAPNVSTPDPVSSQTDPSAVSTPDPLQSQEPASTPAAPAALPAGLPPELAKKIAYATTVMRRVAPLSSDDTERLDAIVGGTPVYQLIKEQEQKSRDLEQRQMSLVDLQWRKDHADLGETLAGGTPPTQLELDTLGEEIENLTKDIESLEARITAALGPLGITKDQLIEQTEHEFPELWVRRAKQVADALLDTNRDSVLQEQGRYPPNACSIDIEGLRQADEHLRALTDQRWQTQQEKEAAEKERWQTDVNIKTAEGQIQVTQEQGHLPAGIAPSQEEVDQMRASLDALDQKIAKLGSDMDAEDRDFDLQKSALAQTYPILLAKDYQPGSLYQLSGEDLSKVTGAWTQELLDNIETTRDNIADDKLLVWQLPDIPEMTYQSLGVPQDSVLGAAVHRYTADKDSDKSAWAIARVVFEIGAVIIVSALATPAAGAALGAAFTVGHLADDIESYQVASAASNVALDPEWSRLADDPSVAWILLDVAALGLDALMIAKALAPAARAMEASGEIAEFSAQARKVAPEAADQLTATARRRLALQVVEEGVPSAEAETRSLAKAVTSDGLHEIRVLEDGTLVRCSDFCARMGAFFKELLDDPKYKDLADKFRDIELRSRSQIAEVRDAALKEAADLEPTLRQNAGNILADELAVNPKAAEAMLEVSSMSDLKNDPELLKFLSSRPPEVIDDFGRAIRLSDSAGKRSIIESILAANQTGKLSNVQLASALNDLSGFLEQYPGRLRGDLASRYFRLLAADTPQAKAELDLAKDILEGKTPLGAVNSLEGVPASEVKGVQVPEFSADLGEGRAGAVEVKTLGVPGGEPQQITRSAIQRNLSSAASQIEAGAGEGTRNGFIRLDGRGALPSALTEEQVVNAVKGQIKQSDPKGVVRWVEVLFTDAAGSSHRVVLERVGETMVLSGK